MPDQKPQHDWFYRFSAVVLRIIFKILFRLSVYGQENIPDTGAAVLVANHSSYLDPPVLAVSCKRHISFMSKASLFKVPILKSCLRSFEAFPVNRGKADIRAFKTAIGRIKEGRLISLFPEGTRQHLGPKKLGPMHDGAAYLILKSGVPLIPVGISGTDKIMPKGHHFPRFPRISVKIGDPIHIDTQKPDQAKILEISKTMEEAIISLLI